jgi:hypothetical protein
MKNHRPTTDAAQLAKSFWFDLASFRRQYLGSCTAVKAGIEVAAASLSTVTFGELNMAKYGKKAQKSVKKAMHKMKRGKLKSGGSGKKVTSRKQAVAIGLSEARKKGAKVAKKKTSKKTTSKKKSGGKRKS